MSGIMNSLSLFYFIYFYFLLFIFDCFIINLILDVNGARENQRAEGTSAGAC